MSTEPYVSEFLACIRHPVHEPDRESTFHATITRWQPDLGGAMKPHAFGPVTPQRALELGFNLDKIIGDALAAAVLDKDVAVARAEKAEVERDTAKAEWTEMAKQAQDAVEAKVAAERVAGNLAATIEAERQEKTAILAQLDAALAPKVSEGPSNPLLNALTFGKLGK